MRLAIFVSAIFALLLTACTPSFDLDALSFGGADAGAFPSDAEAPSDAIEPDLGGYDDAYTAADAADAADAGIQDAPSAPDVPPADAQLTPEDLNCHDAIDNDDDHLTDCADPDCGIASCNDDNDCTDDMCETPSGMCLHMFNNVQGTGWQCVDGVKHETNCVLLSGDEDGDGFSNCDDPDCCADTLCLRC